MYTHTHTHTHGVKSVAQTTGLLPCLALMYKWTSIKYHHLLVIWTNCFFLWIFSILTNHILNFVYHQLLHRQTSGSEI